MNIKLILKTTGKIILFEALLLCLPLMVSLFYKDGSYIYFIKSIIITACVGILLFLIPSKEHRIYAKEGFIIVSLSWIIVSILGAFPFYLSGEIPRFIDALFETVSGFTKINKSK